MKLSGRTTSSERELLSRRYKSRAGELKIEYGYSKWAVPVPRSDQNPAQEQAIQAILPVSE
jgi:hypothetical protein